MTETPFETRLHTDFEVDFPFSIYLAGPMSGYPEWNFPAFHNAAWHLRKDPGVIVTSPAEIDEAFGFDTATKGEAFTRRDWHNALRRDIRLILDCDGIVLLPGWEKSEGANIELTVAKAIGLEVFLYFPEHGMVWWPGAYNVV